VFEVSSMQYFLKSGHMLDTSVLFSHLTLLVLDSRRARDINCFSNTKLDT